MKSLVFTLLIFSILTLSAQNNVVEFYTIDYNTQMLCKIDTKGGYKEIGSIGVSAYKYLGLDFNKKDGNLYVTISKSLYKVDVKTGNLNFVTEFFKTDGGMGLLSTFLSFNDEGEAFIFNEQSAGDEGKLYRLDNYQTGELIHLGNSTSGMASILGIEFDNTGKLWALDECCKNGLNFFNLKNGKIGGSIMINSRLRFPTDLDFQNNNMYFLDIKSEFTSNQTDLCKVDLVTGNVEVLHTFNTILTCLSEYHAIEDTCDNTVFKYKNFLEKEKINFEGDAVEYDGIIRLTKPTNFQNGVVWYKDYLPLQSSFKTEFTFRISEGDNFTDPENSQPGADGIALIFQNDVNNKIGTPGGGIGYSGLKNALVIELDLFKNEDSDIQDPNGNHLAIFANKGKVSSDHSSSDLIYQNKDIPEIIGNSKNYTLMLDYSKSNKALTITLKGYFGEVEVGNLENFDFSKYIDLEGGNSGFIGISGSTGKAVQRQEILGWSFCSDDKIQSVNETENLTEVYPNPSSEIVYFTKIKENILNIKLLDQLGKEVNNIEHNLLRKNINISQLPFGVYYAIVTTSEKVYYSKIIKY